MFYFLAVWDHFILGNIELKMQLNKLIDHKYTPFQEFPFGVRKSSLIPVPAHIYSSQLYSGSLCIYRSIHSKLLLSKLPTSSPLCGNFQPWKIGIQGGFGGFAAGPRPTGCPDVTRWGAGGSHSAAVAAVARRGSFLSLLAQSLPPSPLAICSGKNKSSQSRASSIHCSDPRFHGGWSLHRTDDH